MNIIVGLKNRIFMKSFRALKNEICVTTARMFARTLLVEDISADYINCLNNKEVNKYLEVRLCRQTGESVANFIKKNLESESDLLLGLFKKDDKDLIGTIRISDISSFHFFATLGICLFKKEQWGKGYAVESLLRIKEFLFDDMGMHYIDAGMYSQNVSSVKLFERAGFECYVKISDKYRLEDKFVDVLMFRAVNPNFNF